MRRVLFVGCCFCVVANLAFVAFGMVQGTYWTVPINAGAAVICTLAAISLLPS